MSRRAKLLVRLYCLAFLPVLLLMLLDDRQQAKESLRQWPKAFLHPEMVDA